MSDVVTEVRGTTGLITLNRPKALNALSLDMVRQLASALLAWRDDPAVTAVAIRGQGRDGAFGNFSAGGDIRFFHQAALAGNPQLEDFFTEEYELNFLVDTFPKPYVAFLDGIVIGGGMGIAGHGRSAQRMRLVTGRTKMSMPETQIGLFPDVGGGSADRKRWRPAWPTPWWTQRNSTNSGTHWGRAELPRSNAHCHEPRRPRPLPCSIASASIAISPSTAFLRSFPRWRPTVRPGLSTPPRRCASGRP
jgi:hypothetical protein